MNSTLIIELPYTQKTVPGFNGTKLKLAVIPILRSRCPKSGLCFHGKIISSRTEYYICIVWLSARRHSSVVITTLTNHNQHSTWCQVLENGVRACARRVVFHKESILLTLKRNAPYLIEVWILIIWSVSYNYLIVISDSYVELREIYFPIVITYFGMNCESLHLCSRSMPLQVKERASCNRTKHIRFVKSFA